MTSQAITLSIDHPAHRIRLITGGFLVAFCALFSHAASAETSGSLQFPTVQGKNLEGEKFNLPKDFKGEANLAIVAFQRWHQDLIDPWIGVAKELMEKHEGFNYYELPTIYRGNPLFRFWLDKGMASGIPSEEARKATITLYLDKPEFRESLGIPNEETIHLFLVRPDGSVAFRTEGEMTEKKVEELRAAVKKMLDSSKKK